MDFIDYQLLKFKQLIESAISENGLDGKNDLIRTSVLINLIHDAVKQGFIDSGIRSENIFPRLGSRSPELKIAGELKQKDQDICITPSNIPLVKTPINWGPLAYQNKTDLYGYEFSNQTLIVNVRSQMSSLAKNSDTLFERTFAEALNLHMRYPNMVLGEVYMIPVFEYDDLLASHKEVGFKSHPVDLEKYICFFNALNNRPIHGHDYCYERCALLLVDFRPSQPRLFTSSAELKQEGLISPDFQIEYSDLSFHSFFKSILTTYADRFDIHNLLA